MSFPNWDQLSSLCTGKLILPQEEGYEKFTFSFNSHFKKTPAAVLMVESDTDIVLALEFAKKHALKTSILNGGHSTVASGLNSNGLVINMRRMNKIDVDVNQKTIHVGAGALSEEIDAATNPFQLALPLGDCPVVGIAGLALGGGNGFLSRSEGLTCDHMLEATLVTFNGEILTCNKFQNADLFRLLKGAGQGNFGVVTSMRFSLVDIPEKVAGGNICWNISEGPLIISRYHEMLKKSDIKLNLYLRINQELGPMVKVYGMYNGDPEAGMHHFNEILQWAKPIFNNVDAYSYNDIQKINASTIVEGPCFLWRNGIIENDITPSLIKVITEAYSICPTPYCRINIDTLGGAIQSSGNSDTAFVHRHSQYILSIMGVWFDTEDKRKSVEWANDTYAKLLPFFSGAVYQNYADPAIDKLDERYYGELALKVRNMKILLDPHHGLIGTINPELPEF